MFGGGRGGKCMLRSLKSRSPPHLEGPRLRGPLLAPPVWSSFSLPQMPAATEQVVLGQEIIFNMLGWLRQRYEQGDSKEYRSQRSLIRLPQGTTNNVAAGTNRNNIKGERQRLWFARLPPNGNPLFGTKVKSAPLLLIKYKRSLPLRRRRLEIAVYEFTLEARGGLAESAVCSAPLSLLLAFSAALEPLAVTPTSVVNGKYVATLSKWRKPPTLSATFDEELTTGEVVPILQSPAGFVDFHQHLRMGLGNDATKSDFIREIEWQHRDGLIDTLTANKALNTLVKAQMRMQYGTGRERYKPTLERSNGSKSEMALVW
ncbi:hypothetical protein BDK51DRAFT_28824 [Blyttiomyces helicus]|uniref:Uncharacterized protein n=1 Tax=Blyttiomyces helicus TaxID=388810 RepID=A0A4P9W012_9FUNG|nr:hypothetical protein BDK51DRAFT_28824 [Blyttiomyces helicus]|eukprot:RKO84962.1 hypothetical protein BDK51DRAFT_28824 [Blyttiomyces helicus]